jgi:Holliday junction DNA helicase RuvA
VIAYLEGTLQRIDDDSIVLLNQGIGYQIFLPRNTLQDLPPEGSPVHFHIHMVVREDAHLLFGFPTLAEKAIFLKLIQVNSIGPKMAMNILSGLPANELAQAIHSEDLVRLTAIPGIGKKTAERLIVDLKDKVLEWIGSSKTAVGNATKSAPTKISEEALSALMNLGYSRQEAVRALGALGHDKDWPLERLVKEGLKALS